MSLSYTPCPLCVVKREWTNRQEAVLRENWGLHSASQIAAVIGRSRRAVIGRANRLKLIPRREARSPAVSDESVRRIAEIVAEEFQVELDEMMGRRRQRYLALPRQAVWKIAREVLGVTLQEIGRRCQRDHTSILSGIRSVERAYEVRPVFREKFDRAYARVRMLS